MLKARHPSFQELSYLEQALEVSSTSLPKRGEPRLKIGFLNEYYRPSEPADGRYIRHGQQAIVTLEAKKSSYADHTETFAHEFSHHWQTDR
jgi:hypothetical protein